VKDSFRTLYEAQYNNRQKIGGAAKEQAWFFDRRRMGGTRAKGTFYYIVVLHTACLARGT